MRSAPEPLDLGTQLLQGLVQAGGAKTAELVRASCSSFVAGGTFCLQRPALLQMSPMYGSHSRIRRRRAPMPRLKYWSTTNEKSSGRLACPIVRQLAK